jgi:hypothetical protein
MSLRFLSVGLLVAGLGFSGPLWAGTTSTLEDQKNLGITIYNDNLALVRDTRGVTVSKGRSVLSFADVSAQIKPQTALLGGNKFAVLEQNFDFDLLTPQKLLEKAVGQTVRLYRENPATGAETVEEATILSTNGGTVLQIGYRIEVMGPAASIPGRLVFDQIPENLRARPTLSMAIDSRKARTEDVTLNYLTEGLGWKADYVAYLNDDETELSLQGWVTLTNNSGTAFNNAQVQLVAGEVNQVYEPQPRRRDQAFMARASMSAEAVAQEQLGEYHLYTLPNRTSVANRQTKQVSFVEVPIVKARTFLEVQGGSWYYFNRHKIDDVQKAVSFLEIENETESGLGKPLPKGVMRLYKADSKGTAQFLGEDRINHTASGETIKLQLGQSFDVSAKRKQTHHSSSTRIVEGAKLTDYRTSFDLELNNGKESPVQVRIVETMSGNWSITEENMPHTKEDAFTAVWLVDVPAKGKTTLKFSVLTSATR